MGITVYNVANSAPARTKLYGFYCSEPCRAHLQRARDLRLAKQLAQESLRPPARALRPLFSRGCFCAPRRGQEYGPVDPLLGPGLQYLRALRERRGPPGYL